ESSRRMRRGSADSIRASRHSLHKQAGYRTAAYSRPTHQNRSWQTGGVHIGTVMKRQSHFIVAGDTALAINTWRELSKRGRPVTRILREAPEEGELSGVDVVVGDPGSVEVLKQAGAERAEAVLAMLDDDSENAFVVLAVKETGSRARTVAAVNEAGHLERIKLVQPDVVIAPQVLGGELMAMLLSGEQVTADFVMQRVFQQAPARSPPAPPNA
ncbi:MAG: NAD-binding protein, partial [Gammaproteobacteria bacterium]|nr:NAD-binding protein [Gammaproteobacteria bacterium]